MTPKDLAAAKLQGKRIVIDRGTQFETEVTVTYMGRTKAVVEHNGIRLEVEVGRLAVGDVFNDWDRQFLATIHVSPATYIKPIAPADREAHDRALGHELRTDITAYRLPEEES